jgi:hypothetical protein
MHRHQRISCTAASKNGGGATSPGSADEKYEAVNRKLDALQQVIHELTRTTGIGCASKLAATDAMVVSARAARADAPVAVARAASQRAAARPAAGQQTVVAAPQPRGVEVSRRVTAVKGLAAGRDIVQTIDNSQHHININLFGQEDTSHITRGDIWRIFNALGPIGADLRRASEQAILRAAMLIYSDEQHPENITCYIPNKKGKEAMVHDEKGWAMQPINLVLSPMAAKSVDALFKKQPLPGVDGIDEGANIDVCTKILRHIADHEGDLTSEPSAELRAIPIRNKGLLERVLAKLPNGK